MHTRLIPLALILFALLLIPFDQSRAQDPSAQQPIANLQQWAGYSIGDLVYAEVVEAPDALYRDPSFGSDPDQWITEPNTFLFGEAINVSARHRFLDRDHVVRVKIMEGGWGELEPDGLHNPYIPEPTDYHPTYIHLSYLYPFAPDEFESIRVYDDTQNMDKLVVVIADAHPRLMLYEGEQLIMKIPVVLGPTPYGDFRVYRTRATDDMPGIPGVPFSNYFSGGYTIHGAPWWNWKETVRGHYGSHGCINLPDDEWYQIEHNGEMLSVDQWVYRWMSTNIDYDESDPTTQEARTGADNPGWYQPTATVRVLVVNDIEDLSGYPRTRDLGPLVAEATVTEWQPLIDAYHSKTDLWTLPHMTDDTLAAHDYDATRSIAQIDGTSESDTWILLECTNPAIADELVYPGSSRTVREVCQHLLIDRQGSICTPERVDLDFLGGKTLCNAELFNALHIRERGELIEHEQVHHIQFSNYFGELARTGVATDDLTPGEVTVDQVSIIGVSELMAQSHNVDSRYAEDYVFALARPTASGEIVPVDMWASTGEAWDHLHRECGDPTGEDAGLHDLLRRGLMGEAEAYIELTARCSLPPHQLIPDRSRILIAE